MSESFEEFKESFYYGSRSDLSFKFLKNMGDGDAAAFLQQLLSEVGDAYDTGDASRIVDLAYRTQVEAYAPKPDSPPRWSYDDRPFSPPSKPLAESRVGLLTSSGHFVAGDDPEPFGVVGMSQQQAEDRISEFMREAPILSSIPRTTPSDDLVVRHGGYDTRAVSRDPNVAFPRDALVTAEAKGRIGELADVLYSFPGATAQGKIKKLAGEWAGQFESDGIDVVLLVPV